MLQQLLQHLLKGLRLMRLTKTIAISLALLAALPALAQTESFGNLGSGLLGSGMASYYGNELASGEIFSPSSFTAAHRSLAFGTQVRVTNLSNGADVVVRVNDRGPFVKSRIIDLSYAAAKEIGLTRSGTAMVKLELLR
jgi:rare lipoprotein A